MGGDRQDSENKIYVGGLSPDTTTESLERHFAQHGDIADCIVMMDKAANRSRGFGFVTFRDAAGTSAALGAANAVDGRTVSTKKAVREGAMPQGNSGQDSGASFNVVKIFVGGLPSSCDHDKLTDYFGKFGKITDAVVMMDNQTQRHRGFGYCTFDESSAVEAVMAEFKDHKIDGKWVECKRCIPQDKMRDGGDKGRGRDRDRSRGRDNRASGRGGGGDPRGGSAQPDYTQAWADYYARGGDPYAAYAAYGMGGYPQQAAYGAYGYPGAYGAYPQMAGYPQGGANPAAAYAAYYGQAPGQAYPGAPGVPPQGALPPVPTAKSRSPSRSSRSGSKSRSKSRSRSRARRR